MKKNIVPMKKLYSATLALLVAICLSTLLITACAEINQPGDRRNLGAYLRRARGRL